MLLFKEFVSPYYNPGAFSRAQRSVSFAHCFDEKPSTWFRLTRLSYLRPDCAYLPVTLPPPRQWGKGLSRSRLCVTLCVKCYIVWHPAVTPFHYQGPCAMTTSTRTSEICIFNDQKNDFCPCVFFILTFVWHALRNNQVKWPHLESCGERQRRTLKS